MYWSQGEGYYGYSPAKKISDETGGRLIDVGNNGNKLQAAFQQIEDELRTQYVATTYLPTPSRTARSGALGSNVTATTGTISRCRCERATTLRRRETEKVSARLIDRFCLWLEGFVFWLEVRI